MQVQRQAAYAICEGISPQDLAQKVQMMMIQGFVPSGGVVVAAGQGISGPGGLIFYQAVFFIHDVPIPEGETPPANGPRLVES